MYPLLLMLVVSGCSAWGPFFEAPIFERPIAYPPRAYSAWGPIRNYPSRYESNWMSDFQTPPYGSPYGTVSPMSMMFNPVPTMSAMSRMPTMPAMPAMPVMPPMPAFPKITIPSDPSKNAVCREVTDVKDLSFPPYSEIPTENMKAEDILENVVNRTTYLCKDSDDKEFYVLRTHAVFSTGNIRNKQDTLNYYSLEKSPLDLGKDVKIDEMKIWEKLDALDKEKETSEIVEETPISHPFWSHFWSPSRFLAPFSQFGETSNNAECEEHKYMPHLDYPKIDVAPDSVPGEIVSKDVTYETKLCTDKTTNKKYYSLKTGVKITTSNGQILNRYSTVAHAADSDGNPLPRADGATSVVSSTVSSVTNGVPKTMSSFSTYHHQ